MLKRTALAGLGLALLVSPLLASAQSLSDLQAQIAQLLAQIQVLQQQVNQGQNQTSSSSSLSGSSCVSISNSLSLDDTDADTNGDVSKLQQFLSLTPSIYPEARITGYFGPATQRAVQRWQSSNGLVSSGDPDTTGYGYAGPKTRAAMAAGCGGVARPTQPAQTTPPVRACPMIVPPSCNVGYRLGGICGQECVPDDNTVSSLSASPSYGSAPLSVTLTTEGLDPDGLYEIYFGDGTASGLTEAGGGFNIVHNYTSASTYTARLLNANKQTIGTATITVGGNEVAQCPTYDSKPVITSITPSSGPVGTTIEIRGCNFLGFEGDKEIWFTNSRGEKGFLNGQMDTATRASNTVARVTLSQRLCTVNSYSGLDCPVLELVPGSYTVYSNSYGGNSNKVNFTVTGSNSSTRAPVVNGIDGPASLNAGQVGKWTVNASVPNQAGAQLSYSVVWGDESFGYSSLASSPASASLQSSATFTHIYKYNNTYKPKFTVSNSAGSASAEMAVAVGQFSVSVLYEQVKCVFNGATTAQKCWGDVPASAAGGSPTRYDCSGAGTCTVSVKGPQNTPITWGSSCGGSANTTIDGNNEYATFSCRTTQTTGKLEISTDPSTPKYTISTGGSIGVPLSAFKIRASGEAIKLDKIGLILSTDTAYAGDIVQLYLYSSDGSIIGNAVFTGNQNTVTAILNRPITIAKDTDVKIVVGGDIAMIGQSQPARAGDLIKVFITSASGAGVTSGTTISVNQLNSGPDTIAGVRIFRSYPVVAQVPLSSDGLADGKLMRFKVTASSAGDVGLNSFSVTLSPSFAAVLNMKLFAYTDSSYSNPVSGVQTGGLVVAMPASFSVGSGQSQNFILQASQPVEVPAGATYYFEFRGTVVSSGNNSVVTTTLNGDSTAQQPILTSTPDRTSGAFIWSPNTFTTSQPNTLDWTNGYGVDGLPAGGISQTRTGSGGTTSSGITVTAPNGGEQWEIGQLNTITWSPYGYNPDVNPASDIVATLMKSIGNGSFAGIGKIIPGGKASIHWEGVIEDINTGQNTTPQSGPYYINVYNKTTGASDMSDAPFTLLPKPVDLKINGSDGPITATAGVPLTATWTASGSKYCRLDNAYDMPVPTVYPIPAFDNLPTSGTRTIYVPQEQNWYVSIGCLRPDGTTLYDSVVVNAGTAAATLQITSPNGGEQIDREAALTIGATATGLKSYSIALYKNDQWKAWIIRDASTNSSADIEHTFRPSDFVQGLGEGDNAGAIWKIYITSQKADGSGYIDDKSDAPFSFVATAQPSAPTLTLTASPSTITAGQSSTLTWSSTNATSCTAYENGSPAQYNPEKVLFNDSSTQTFYETKTYTFTCTGPGGSVTKSVTVTVNPASASSVDMTVNSSSGPVPISDNQPITVSLTTSNVTSCTISGVRMYEGGPSHSTQIPMRGNFNEYSFYSYVPGYGTMNDISVQCTGTDGSTQSDSVSLYYDTSGSEGRAPSDKNLANVLTALESALKSLLQQLKK